MEQPVITPTPEAPATIPVTSAALSLKEQIALNQEGKTEIPNPAVATSPEARADATPEATAQLEADSTKPDAELSDAGRKLRSSRLDQRKAKLQGEITELNELLRVRRELRDQIAAVVPQAPAPAEPRTAGPAIDPRDPEPTYEAFAAANPTHPDPYAGYLRAQAAWDRRQENRAFAVSRQQQEAQGAVQQAVASYQTRASELRTQHSDYDAVVQPLLERYAQHPYSPAVAAFLASDPDAARVIYHVAKHQDAEASLFSPQSNPLVALGELKATVKGSSRTKTTSTAPAPPSQTAGTGATATHDDPNTRSTREHFRIRAQEDADARRRALGLR